jgi:hypothetical protein
VGEICAFDLAVAIIAHQCMIGFAPGTEGWRAWGEVSGLTARRLDAAEHEDYLHYRKLFARQAEPRNKRELDAIVAALPQGEARLHIEWFLNAVAVTDVMRMQELLPTTVRQAVEQHREVLSFAWDQQAKLNDLRDAVRAALASRGGAGESKALDDLAAVYAEQMGGDDGR